MWVGLLGWAGGLFGIPRTDKYDSLVKSTGTSLNPHLVLAGSRSLTIVLLIFSFLLPMSYSFFFNFSHPLLFLPSLYLLSCFFLEFFGLFEFSPLILLVSAYVSWRRIQVENELPYAMLFMNQLLSLGIPVETALRDFRKQEHLKSLVVEMEHPKLKSRRVGEFMGFIEQCKRVGATKQILDDLLVMSNNERDLTISRFKSMGAMAANLFTYILALYTSSILFIIVTNINAGSAGMEFLLLDFINPLLFVAGFLYLIKGWSS